MARKKLAALVQHVAQGPSQREPLPGQMQNNAGGYSWEVSCWQQLERFLILGSDGGTYYVSEGRLTRENAQSVLQCLQEDPRRTVETILGVWASGRAPKAQPVLFALALAHEHGDAATRAFIHKNLTQACRIPTHLFLLAESIASLRSGGLPRRYAQLSNGFRRAVAAWYQALGPERMAYYAVKYQQREGWSHRDLLRLVHPKLPPAFQPIARWIVRREEADWEGLPYIEAFEKAQRAKSAREVIAAIREGKLPREAVPSQWLKEAAVWEALLPQMPMVALIRNLGVMTSCGLLAPLSQATGFVCSKLQDGQALRASRVHPIQVLAALQTYNQGHGARGRLQWEPVPQIVSSLTHAFYESFKNAPRAGQRFLLGLDVSGSMGWGEVCGLPGLAPRAAAAAMAMVTAYQEPQVHTMAFADTFRPFPLHPPESIFSVMKRMEEMPFGPTDCAQPMLWALEKKVPVDVFVIYTDSETWYGQIHPARALAQYRQAMGLPAKLAVVAMVSNRMTIADPQDPGMLDIVGFDSSAPAILADFASGGQAPACQPPPEDLE